MKQLAFEAIVFLNFAIIFAILSNLTKEVFPDEKRKLYALIILFLPAATSFVVTVYKMFTYHG